MLDRFIYLFTHSGKPVEKPDRMYDELVEKRNDSFLRDGRDLRDGSEKVDQVNKRKCRQADRKGLTGSTARAVLGETFAIFICICITFLCMSTFITKRNERPLSAPFTLAPITLWKTQTSEQKPTESSPLSDQLPNQQSADHLHPWLSLSKACQ